MLNDLSAVLCDVEAARGLPSEFYGSDDVYRQERQSVFFANWSAIGFGKHAPQPGDAYPVTFMGVPLLIVRGKDAHVRVFENVCRALRPERDRLSGWCVPS